MPQRANCAKPRCTLVADGVSRLMVQGQGRPTMGSGQAMVRLGRGPITYPTAQLFGSWKYVETGTSLYVWPKRLGKLVQYSCGIVLVFWFWREIVFGITYVLSVQNSCAVVSVFWSWRKIVLWREIVLKMRTPFDFLWAVSTRNSYWVTLLWSNSQCVYFARPNTLLLCIFLFCIFLLYHTDSQVEVQIRILLKDKYVWNRVKIQTPAITL